MEEIKYFPVRDWYGSDIAKIAHIRNRELANQYAEIYSESIDTDPSSVKMYSDELELMKDQMAKEKLGLEVLQSQLRIRKISLDDYDMYYKMKIRHIEQLEKLIAQYQESSNV